MSEYGLAVGYAMLSEGRQSTVGMLSEAGMGEAFVNEDGEPAMRLTPKGEQVARQMALGADEDALLEALLDASQADAT